MGTSTCHCKNHDSRDNDVPHILCVYLYTCIQVMNLLNTINFCKKEEQTYLWKNIFIYDFCFI